MCMDRLEALTKKLVGELKDISIKQQDHIIYDIEQGTAISFTLKRDDDVHLLDSFLSAGTIFPLHHHDDSAETLILTSGEITVVCDEPGCDTHRQELQVGVPMYIPSGMNHFLHAKKDSWILATLIPPDAGMIK